MENPAYRPEGFSVGKEATPQLDKPSPRLRGKVRGRTFPKARTLFRRLRLLADRLRDLFLPVELGAAARDLLGRQPGDIREIELPGRVGAPAQWRLHGRARRRGRFQHPQRKLQRERLRFRVMRPARRIAEREIAEQKARHADIFDNVLGASHDHGRDAVLFEVTGGQTHGLVTHRSNRDENDRVNLVLAHPLQQLRAIPVQGRAVAAVGRRAVKARRDLADPPGSGEPPQRRQREPGIAVLGCRMRAVVADMRDAQIVIAIGLAGIDRVELGGAVIRRARSLVALVRLIRRRRRDQPDPALGQRLVQRRERHLGVMRPAIRRAIAERLIIIADPRHIRDRRVVLGRKAEPLLLTIVHRITSHPALKYSASSGRGFQSGLLGHSFVRPENSLP